MGGASGIFGYRYAGKTKGRRFERWREEFGRRWIAADFKPIGEDYFVNQFSGTEHSFLALCHMRSTPSCFYRRSDPVSSGYRYVLVAAGLHPASAPVRPFDRPVQWTNDPDKRGRAC